MQVYLAWWHETSVAVKLLLHTGMGDAEAITDQALSLSNPVMRSLQMVTTDGFCRHASRFALASLVFDGAQWEPRQLKSDLACCPLQEG